jgi:WD40 repeat protein
MQRNRVHSVDNSVGHPSLCILRRLLPPTRLIAGSLLSFAIGASCSSPESKAFAQNSAQQNDLDADAVVPQFDLAQITESQAVLTQKAVDVIRLAPLPGQTESPVVTAISVSPNEKNIAASGDDHAIRIVSLATGATQSVLVGHDDWVKSVAFSPSGDKLASCSSDGTIRIWLLGDMPRQISMHQVEHALHSLVFPSEQTIFAVGFSNKIYQLDVAAERLSVSHVCDCRDIRSIDCSPDGKWLAYGGRDGVLHLHRNNAVSEAASINVPMHLDRIRSVQFSSDGRFVTSVGEDRVIARYDVATLKVVEKNKTGGGKLMAMCPLDRNMTAISGSDNSIRIYDETSQRLVAKLVGHDGSVCILRRTAHHLISGSFDTTIRIWDIEKTLADVDADGRFVHPVAAQFEDSGAEDSIR